MNLLIAILSDAYEIVTSEKKYYDGKAKIQRSLQYERLAILMLGLFGKKKEQAYHYLFVSMPLGLEEDTNNEDEGMIGKILSVARANHKEVNTKIEEAQAKNVAKQEKIDAKIDEKINSMQE